jgi:hypothetical protein
MQAQPITDEQVKCLGDKGFLSITDAAGLPKNSVFLQLQSVWLALM